MRVVSPFAFALAAALGAQLALSAPQASPVVNGWYPCAPSSPLPDEDLAPLADKFECATIQAPLCHDGICKSDKKVDLFVRRLLANPSKKPATRKAMWFIQGGPGGSSANMEHSMLALTPLLKEEVDMYTVDHRGTGRSSFVDCKAAQAFGAGGAKGVDVDFAELPNCVRDAMFQIENKTEAFSVTSAAKDIEYLTANLYPHDVHTFVYGVSYGTYVTERLMHLAPKHVKGYILDGVVPEDNPSFTTTTLDQIPPAERLVAACEKDAFCSSKFPGLVKQPGGLKAAWFALYDALDKAAPGKNKCADALRDAETKEPPSFKLRSLLGGMATDLAKRTAIPAVFYRTSRCEARDVAFLEVLFGLTPKEPAAPGAAGNNQTASTPAPPAAFDQVGGMSPLLGGLIKVSEMWSAPSLSWEDEQKDFKKGLLSGGMKEDFALYCVLTRSFSDPACTFMKTMFPTVDFVKLEAPKFVYKPDAYWHKFAAIPSHASVLVVNGKLDFQTLSDGGVREYKNLKGDAAQKMLVEFEFGGHGVGLTPSTFSDDTNCGTSIIASFVAHDGKTSSVDTKCLAKAPAIRFDELDALQTIIPTLESVQEFYEADPNGDAKKNTKTRHKRHEHKHKRHQRRHDEYPHASVTRSVVV